MNTLKVPVVSIGEEGLAFEESATVASIQPSGARSLTIETVIVAGRFERMGDEYLFRGRISGVFSEACCRCLSPTDAPVDVDVAWVFAEGPATVFEEIGHVMEMNEDTAPCAPASEDSHRAFQGAEINLGPFVWEEMVLAAPSRYLCKTECRGLCPRCGANLNEDECNCAASRREEPIGNRGLAGLAQMFPELAPDRSKEY